MSTITTDPNLQSLRINDFSPGIVQFGRVGYGVTYSPGAPLGSAAAAYRCINLAGIGLIPLPSYAAAPGSPMFTSVAPDANTTLYCTGFTAFGPVITDGTGPQRFDNIDQILMAMDFTTGANTVRHAQVTKWASDTGQTSQQQYDITGGVSINYRHCPNFVTTRIVQNGAPGAFPPATPVCVWPQLDISRIYFAPDVTSNLATMPASGSIVPTSAGVPMHVVAHAARVGYMNLNQSYSMQGNGPVQNASTDEDMFTSDPPLSYTFPLGYNQFVPETFSGFGAWGSINSGELLIIKRGGGGLIISGDLRAPSAVTKLPGVMGTGRVMQRAAQTPAGLLYVTENDGVYSWNGGNTSQKISRQIPDNACRRSELPLNTLGTLSVHDSNNNLCFFANNWIFDCLTNSWWRLEDTSIQSMSLFARSAGSRYMWAAQGSNPSGVGSIPFFRIDFNNPAKSWSWLSNPIPVSIGSLMELEYVEIVGSNPTTVPALYTITPTTPVGIAGLTGNNPGNVVLTIPPSTSAGRVGARLGVRGYNVQVKCDATTDGAQQAPILHELILGYRISGTPVGFNQ